MARKGYASELRAKKELIKDYGFFNVVKVSISQQGADFIVLGCGELIKVVEVKECHQNKYYAKAKEKIQFDRIANFARSHGVPAELWIYTRKPKKKLFIKQTQYLYSP